MRDEKAAYVGLTQAGLRDLAICAPEEILKPLMVYISGKMVTVQAAAIGIDVYDELIKELHVLKNDTKEEEQCSRRTMDGPTRSRGALAIWSGQAGKNSPKLRPRPWPMWRSIATNGWKVSRAT